MFTPQEFRTHFARIEREQTECNAEIEDDDAFDKDDELILKARRQPRSALGSLPLIKELLTAAELGTS